MPKPRNNLMGYIGYGYQRPAPIDLDLFNAVMHGQSPNAFLTQRAIPGSAPILPGELEALPESTFLGGREYANEQGPPMPPFMAFNSGNKNALRRALYPYLQMLGWAEGEQQ